MGYKKAKLDYDEKYDSLFVFCEDEYEYKTSLELDSNIILDFSVDGVPVAFEFLNASNLFNVNKDDFSKIKSLNIKSKITKKEINITVKILISRLNKAIDTGVNRVISNNLNVPEYDSEIALA